jgi:hypothetical protein
MTDKQKEAALAVIKAGLTIHRSAYIKYLDSKLAEMHPVDRAAFQPYYNTIKKELADVSIQEV